MQTPYGELSNGDIYYIADGSNGYVTVVDVDMYAYCEDVVVEYDNGTFNRIDWFKLMMVRYSKGDW